MSTGDLGNTTRQAIAAIVRGKVAELDVRQMDLAAAIGMDQQALSRRMRGKVDFTATELMLIAAYLKIDVADLMPATAVNVAVAS